MELWSNVAAVDVVFTSYDGNSNIYFIVHTR